MKLLVLPYIPRVPSDRSMNARVPHEIVKKFKQAQVDREFVFRDWLIQRMSEEVKEWEKLKNEGEEDPIK